MNTSVSAKGIAEMSPRVKARMAGACEVLEGLTATFGQVIVLNRLVVRADATATATNILAHQPLFRLGFASSLIGVAFHAASALGELPLQLWLLVKGVNSQRWMEQASAAGEFQ